MIIEPIGDNILIQLPREESKENKTQSGILLPKKTEAEARKDIATVVAVGSGRILNDGSSLKPVVKAGDKVLCQALGDEEEADGGHGGAGEPSRGAGHRGAGVQG